MNTTSESLTVKEAAVKMRLSQASVYGLCAAKKLRHVRVGVGRGKILIPPDAIEEYLAKGTVGSNDTDTPVVVQAKIKLPVRMTPRHVRMKP